MNGAIETKSDVVGSGSEAQRTGERILRVSSMQVAPQELLLRGDAAIVISALEIDATVRGQPLPKQMRILSVFTRTQSDPEWRLTARSITPLLNMQR